MFTSVNELETALTTPSDGLVQDMKHGTGDLLILGAGGKMGPTLARLARAAMDRAGREGDQVLAVSRWSDPEARAALESARVQTIQADLLSDDGCDSLPQAENVLFMVGAKFGAATNPSWAWEVNAALPDRVARKYRDSKITAFSTGNVYPLVSVDSGGCTEDSPTGPVGEYAMSCLGRERVFQFGAAERGTPLSIIRLNYAVDLRYGVLYDIAAPILAGQPVDLTTGHVNIVWQGYANEVTLRAMTYAQTDPFILNLTGPEVLSVRSVASRLAELMDKPISFVGEPADSALLNNAGKCFDLFGYPDVSAGTLIKWQAQWLNQGLPVSGRPTKFAVRDGKF